MHDDDTLSESIVADARRDASALASEGRWRKEDEAELERRFERATYDALRAPRLAERSVRLRKIARHTVPRAWRPRLRRGLARIEHVYEFIRDRKDNR
ncbi:MAG: hypothetical protein WCF24_02650 [Acidimicrobiales bacterium]